MGFPTFFLPEAPGSTPTVPGGTDGSFIILQGFGGGSLISQGYGGSAAVADTSHVILQGFGGGSLISQGYGGSSPVVIVYPSDNAAFQDILGLLDATKEFNEVLFGRRFDLSLINANNPRIAHVQHLDTNVSPDGSIERDFNAVTYALTLAFSSTSPADEISEELDKINRIARNVMLLLTNKSYGGFCIPRFSRLTKTTPDLTKNPVCTVRILGQFAYSVDLTTGYFTTD